MIASRVWTWVKWASLAVSVGSIALAVGLIAFGDHGAHLRRITAPTGGTKVDKPLIVERKGDRLLWRLQANKAEQQPKGWLLLTRPTLELFTATGKKVIISGRRARFDPLHRNIVFNDHVVVLYEQWRLSCASLAYDNARDEITVPGAFVAVGDKMTIKGKGLRADRDSQRAWVEHGVNIVDRGSHLLGLHP